MKNKNKKKYMVLGDNDDCNDCIFDSQTVAIAYAKDMLDGDEFTKTVEVFELVLVKKFKMLATEVKD